MTDVNTDPPTDSPPVNTPVAYAGDVPPPYEDDDEPEFRPRPRRRAHALTFVLGAAVLIAAGFLGGVLLQKHEDHGTSSSATGARAGRFAALASGGSTGTTVAGGSGSTTAGGAAGTGAGGGGGRFGGGFGGAGGGGGGGVAGTVTLVDGKNIYVTDTTGNVVKLETSASSQLSKTDPATTKDVAPGDVVTARATQNSDGSYTASAVTIIPPSVAAAATGG
jgi:hypothetical protein